MATLEQLTQQVNALTTLVNNITSSSKSISEFNAQSPIDTASELAVSTGSTPEKLTVQQIIDKAITDFGSVIPNGMGYKDQMVAISSNYTATINDFVLISTSTADITVTLPTAVGVSGQQINICKVDSNAYDVIVDTTSSQTIIGSLTQTISNQWSNVTFVSDGTNWVIK